MQREDGGTSKGAFGRAVRTLPAREYEAIVQAAYAQILQAPAEVARPFETGFAQEQETFERVIVRPFRDAAFSGSIKAPPCQ